MPGDNYPPVRGKVQYDHVDVIEVRWRGEKATAVVNAIRPALELLRKGLSLLDEFSSDEEFVQALGGTAVSGRNFEKWAPELVEIAARIERIRQAVAAHKPIASGNPG